MAFKRLEADIRWIDTNEFATHYVAVVMNEEQEEEAMNDDSIFFVFYPHEVKPYTDHEIEFLEFRDVIYQ